MGGFQILEHTGEVGVLARGETLAEAFSQAAKGMFSIIAELEAVDEREMRELEVEAADVEALMVAWLNELIYLFEMDGLVFKSFHISEMCHTRLRARCYGERLDERKHSFGVAPKAATYHMLEVAQAPEGLGWRARVILDI